ncbi:ABC transporter substrate-binding protein [Clostridium ljungdahlii]|uniref:ABC transporter substrate-binding protein n=1 Tax=Clostridium ljungdahlii TaxID=1538 RepID=UPI00386ED7E3
MDRCLYRNYSLFVNKKLVKDVPHSFKELLNPEYKKCISVGDVMKAAESQNAVLAAAYANGGDEKNIQPGIDFFKKLNAMGNLNNVDEKVSNFQKEKFQLVLCGILML